MTILSHHGEPFSICWEIDTLSYLPPFYRQNIIEGPPGPIWLEPPITVARKMVFHRRASFSSSDHFWGQEVGCGDCQPQQKPVKWGKNESPKDIWYCYQKREGKGWWELKNNSVYHKLPPPGYMIDSVVGMWLTPGPFKELAGIFSFWSWQGKNLFSVVHNMVSLELLMSVQFWGFPLYWSWANLGKYLRALELSIERNLVPSSPEGCWCGWFPIVIVPQVSLKHCNV